MKTLPICIMTIPMLKELNLKPYTKLDNLKKVSDYLDKLEFSKVKTRYTKGTDWSALSLRGYSDDINNILKPNVLKSKIDKNSKLQDTHLRKENVMKPINEILKKIPTDFERVRFMSLKSKTVIGKHTDKVDKDIKVGKIIRLHVPIRTNDKVEFSVWDKRDKQTHLLKEGFYYYVDVTKPHSVKNNSKVNRIHLVIDCFSNDKLKKLVL